MRKRASNRVRRRKATKCTFECLIERRSRKSRQMRRKRRAPSRSRATARIDCAQRWGRVVLRERRWYVGETALRILIVDDEAPARRRLRELLDDCMCALPLSIVGEAQHGREALDLLQSTPAELVLTDIHMPDMDGIELARHLLKLPNPPVVIFTTAFHEHAVQAFEVNAIDYLVKPVRVQRLLSALQKVPRLKPFSADKLSHLPASARRFLSVTERSRVVLMPIDDVVYLKAELKYITIRTREREFLLEESLTRLENEFGSRVTRVHRNCIVAREAIRGFERHVSSEGDAHWEVLLRDVAEALPVSRRQQYIVREIGRGDDA